MRAAAAVPRLRSALFVPGQRRDFLEKLPSRGADAAILDLEDAVPGEGKREARREVARWLAQRPDGAPVACVRINPLAARGLEEDLAAAVHPSLTAVMVPKVRDATDLVRVEEELAEREARAGVPEGAIHLWPLIETAAAVRNAFEIATCSSRVAYTGGSAGDDGDLALELGFRWSAGFTESLYVRSKVLVDVRAAGVPNPMTGVVTALRDPAQLEAFARQSRGLGYDGMMVIHPSHVAPVNAIFSPSAEELEAARRLIEVMESAEAEGAGAIEHEGRMIDAAMLRAARSVLALAAALEARRG